jgi:DNA mismatch repair protein MutL
MAFPEIFFSLNSNGQEVFHLEKGTLKQRIVQILGSNYNAKLVSVQERTDYLDILGFVGKPETAKKTRGDQYFFVNNRFIKSAYLNHAVMSAFAEMIPKDSFPMYALFIDLDPAQLDINVHPTKQEIKFEDEKIVYAFVQSAVKHALAQFSITPTLDFELDANIQNLNAVNKPMTEQQRSSASSSQLFQTFTQKNQAHFVEKKSELGHWKDFYEKPTQENENNFSNTPTQSPVFEKSFSNSEKPEEQSTLMQMHNAYIVVQNDKGYLLINQQNAHERILYERFALAISGKAIATQQSLFPTTIELAPADTIMLTELLPDLELLGYKLEPFGNNTFVVQGTPADVGQTSETNALEKLIEQYKHFSSDLKFSKREKLLRSLSLQQAIKAGTSLSEKEMKNLIEELFSCEIPNTTPTGKPTYTSFKKDELDKMFGR